MSELDPSTSPVAAIPPDIVTQLAHADPNAAPLSLNELIDTLNPLFSSVIQGSYMPYIISAGTPGPDSSGYAWIQIDGAGRPIAIKIYYAGKWRRVYNGMKGEIRMYQGNPNVDFDTNGLGIVTGTFDGWHLCNGKDGTVDLSDRFIIASHMNNVDHSGWDGTQLVTWVYPSGGLHTGGVTHINTNADNTYRPKTLITAKRFTADGNAPADNGDLLGIGHDGTRWTLDGSDPDGNLTPVNIPTIPPFIALGFIVFVGYA